jgi:hypothetical protein
MIKAFFFLKILIDGACYKNVPMLESKALK